MEKIETVKLLLGEGASTEALDVQGNSSLHLAVEGKKLKVIQILIDAGADIHLLNQNNESPYTIAEKSSDREIVRIFQKPILDRVLGFAIESEEKALPLATSSLPAGRWGNYSAKNAFDGTPGTAWVEGSPDHGVGQRIVFVLPKVSRYINIIPGFADEKLLFVNSSVKEARLRVYLSDYYWSGSWRDSIKVIKEVGDSLLQFENKMRVHPFKLPALPDRDSLYRGRIIAELTIEAVYEGDDPGTCIAEIGFSNFEYIESLSPGGYKITFFEDMYSPTVVFHRDGTATNTWVGAEGSGTWKYESPYVKIHWTVVKRGATQQGERDKTFFVDDHVTLNWLEHVAFQGCEYEISPIEDQPFQSSVLSENLNQFERAICISRSRR